MFRRMSLEAGQSIVIFSMMIAAFTGMVAMVVDVGLAFVNRAEIQASVDAAALAGVQLLPDDPTAARNAAEEIAEANGITEDDGLVIKITSTHYPNDTIEVLAGRQLPDQFASVAGSAGFEIGGAATARVGTPGGLTGFIPLAIARPSLTGLITGDAVALAYDAIDTLSGNAAAVSLPGITDFSQAVLNGSEDHYCIASLESQDCPGALSLSPANLAADLNNGVTDRITSTAGMCEAFSYVVIPSPGNNNFMFDPDCHPFSADGLIVSHRVVIAPIVEALCAGECDVGITSFGMFFIETINCDLGGCDIGAKYIERVANFNDFKLAPYRPDAPFVARRLVE